MKVWGQTGTDYSGYYYIANFTGDDGKTKGYNVSTPATNYYLCPAQPAPNADANYNYDAIYYDGDSKQQPYLTTYRTGRVEEVVWKVEFAEKISGVDYYYIRCCADNNKYLTHNTSKAEANTRFTVHLQATKGTDNESLFCFETTDDESFNIRPQKVSTGNRHINPANGNKNYYYGKNAKSPTTINGNTVDPGGMIGYWSATGADGYASRWYLERVQPTVSYNSSNHTIEITNIDEDVTIYYTDDGTTDPTMEQTENRGTTPIVINDVNNSVSIKAIAAKSGVLPSPIKEIRVVPNATVTLGASSFTYNGSAQEPTVTVKDGDNTISSDEYTVEYGENTNAGDATVTIKNATGGSCIVYGSTTFTINKKDLTVTAQPKTITYGDAPTNDGVLYSGFVEGENESKLTGTLAYAYNYSQYGDVGDYTITPSGLTSNNYNITYVDGTLTVGQKDVGLSWSTTTTFPYDGSSHILTATATDLVNNDEVGVTVTGEQTNAGDHTATASALTGTKAGNYKLPDANTHAFSITKVPLTVTANNHSITYGDALSNSGVTYSGFVGGEDEGVLGGMLDYAYSYNLYDDVGDNYTITPSGLSSTNYTFAYNNGILTVNPKEVGIDWTNTELTYNRSAQAPTAAATGVVNDDDVSVTVTGGQTNAGNYVATASDLTGAKAGNYLLPEGLTQTFTISPKSLGDGETAAEGITLDITTEGGNVVLNSVKDGETTLVNNTDYTYDIQDEASDKIIAIAGIGNYTGSISGVYVCPVFTDADGEGAGLAAAVYQARRDFASPTGVNAYIVRSVNPTIGTLTISKLEYIPKDVPVLLLTASQASGFLTAEKDESTPAVSVGTVNSNMLKVAPTGGVAVKSAEVYMFYLGEFVLAKEGTVKAGKFYVHNPNFTVTPEEPGNQGGSNSRSTLQFVIDDDVTSHLELKNSGVEESKTDVWYTLGGRRLSGKPTKGGIYILKGQKVIIKRK
jgi:hypothetical protein